MFKSLGLVVFNFLLLAAAATRVLPPENLSQRWIAAFESELSWEPPKHSVTKCTYTAQVEPRDPDYAEYSPDLTTHKYSVYMIMDGGFLQWSVTTHCNGSDSEKAVLTVSYPELVKDIECYSYNATAARCSWSQKSDTPDLRFFYQLVSENENDFISDLMECASYVTEGVQTSCNLQANTSFNILIMFNGTVNNTSVRNTFERKTIKNVKPPPLTWSVTKSGTKLNISWVAPDVLRSSSWKYRIDYTECNKMKDLTVVESTSYQINLVPHCRYCMSVVAQSSAGSTAPGKQICIDEQGSNLVYIAVFIPLVFASMVLFAFVCYKKNKDSVFPKVPQPRDLLSDLSNNNNESPHFYVYCPIEDEVSCEVTLVADFQTSKPDC
ncbi:interleukin-13 receptor subunit alpha-1 [Melanotaenia boesemani]|uniref:interleukin-13 receptor subunit alpha-1 n=1 Tax=Melanotaenia boesemani TaxID=1250792 RepID=UPI001C053AD1|nr:interleukin-13 receptor subunit alpha-1 [Melanotaenia boesemani]